MNLTIELPDELAHRLELIAVEQQRTVQQLAVDGLLAFAANPKTNLAPGSPAAVLDAVYRSPLVSTSDADDLAAAIAAARLPASGTSVFKGLADS